MSYLTIFYEIKLSIIKLSIQKCESFINKMNKDEIVTDEIEYIQDKPDKRRKTSQAKPKKKRKY